MVVFRRFSFGSLRQWHWLSSAFCLIGMLLFALTGITLNHASDISATPSVRTVELTLSPAQLGWLAGKTSGPLPFALRQWLYQEHQVTTPDSDAQWDDHELYLGMPKPGGDAWLSLDLRTGELLFEDTQRGAIAYFNDLHKGRHTGVVWSWFLDVFSVLCLVFSLSGLWLLLRYSKTRPSTWPAVVLGLLAPLLVILLTVH